MLSTLSLKIVPIGVRTLQSHDGNYLADQTLPDFSTFYDIPPGAYAAGVGISGPLRVPYLEPAHPVTGELDVNGIWLKVLLSVDLQKTDIEYLAVRLSKRVRCYGEGPILGESDLDAICSGAQECIV